MIVCVDGTGPANDKAYAKEMKNSFVRAIAHSAKDSPRYYGRGPDWTGVGRKLIRPQYVAETVMSNRSRGSGRVFLTGYSRGAAIVIHAARLLRDKGVRVDALFLFDAVDRSIMLEASVIPKNVGVAYHALRDPTTSSRESFGNCGLRAEGGVELKMRWFYTTHGGMGGSPLGKTAVKKGTTVINEGIGAAWYDGKTKVTPRQEAAGMQKVREWMWMHLRAHKVL